MKRCIERNSPELFRRGGDYGSETWRDFIEKVKNVFESDTGVSVREAARILDAPASTVSDTKLKYLGIKAYAQQTATKYTAGQPERCKVACRKILYQSRGKVIIMDDETDVNADPTEKQGKRFYHTVSKTDVDDKHRFAPKAKFPKRYLVWQAVDSRGNVSDACVTDQTMNWKRYLEECLKRRLLPFIKRYHPGKVVLFWPDLATCHYATEVVAWLASQGIPYIQRRDNAPNCPQARPIERFWSLCKRSYRRRSETAQTVHEMSSIWPRLSREVAKRSLRKLCLKRETSFK